MKKETVVDKVFKKAVQEFHSSLISTYSVMMKVIVREGPVHVHIYKT